MGDPEKSVLRHFPLLVLSGVKARFSLALALLSVTLLPCIAIAGTSGTLEGVIKDKQSGEGLPGVNVSIAALRRGVVSTSGGSYRLQDLPIGSYEVRFTLIGYRTYVARNVIINPDLRTRLHVALEPSDVTLDEVVVTQQKPLIQKDVASTFYVVSEQEIRPLPITYPTDILGLKAGTTLEGNVRGGKASEVTYYVDGLSVQDVMGGGLGLRLPLSSLLGMSLYTGGFEPEYGNALSGVVNIITRTGSNQHQFFARGARDNFIIGNQSDDLAEAELSATGPLLRDRLFYSLAMTGTLSGTRWRKDMQRFFGWPVEKELDGFGKLDYVFTPRLRLNTQVLFSLHDWRDYEYSWRLDLGGLPPEERSSYRVAAILSHAVTDDFFYTVSISGLSVSSKIGNGSKADIPVQDPYQYDFFLRYIVSGQLAWWVRSTQSTYVAKLDASLKFLTFHLLKFGGEFQLYNLDSDVLKDEPQKTFFGKPLLGVPQLDFSSIYHYQPFSGAFYAYDKFDLFDEGVLLTYGLRYDVLNPRARRPDLQAILGPDSASAAGYNVPATVKHQLSPRFGLAIPLSEKGSVYYNYGFYYQNPLFNYMYTGLDRVALGRGISALTGNPDLEPERTIQTEIGLKYILPANLVGTLTYFKKTTSNLVDTKTFVSGDSKVAGSYGFTEFINVPEAETYGYELTLSRDQGEWVRGEFSYTYMVAEGTSGTPYDGFYIAQFGLPPGQRVYPLSWDQRHTVKSTIMLDLPADFDLNFVTQWHSGRPYTNYPSSTGYEHINAGAFYQNNARMPPYFTLDVKAEKHWKPGWWSNAVITLYVDIRNATNQQNVSWVDSNGKVGGELSDPSGYYIGRRTRVGLQVAF
jgi:outer membrane receptor for ferrienterochelin and colicin